MADFIELTEKNNGKFSVRIADISDFHPYCDGGTVIELKKIAIIRDVIVVENYEDIRDAIGVIRIGNQKE